MQTHWIFRTIVIALCAGMAAVSPAPAQGLGAIGDTVVDASTSGPSPGSSRV
jgi:hypothetical protein